MTLAVILALAVGASSCGGPSGPTVPLKATPASTVVAAAATSLPPCAEVSATPAGAPAGGTSPGPLWTVAADLAEPDDLLYASGSLFVALHASGAIEDLAPGGASILPIHLDELEGIAAIGSKLYAAGQAQDAVFEWLGGAELRKVIQLEPVAAQSGVDGIAAQGDLLVVPDSPRGLVDWVDPANGRIVRQVGGFTRPTGAWPEPNGSVLIADEFGNAVFRVAPDGRRTVLVSGLRSVDDVAEDSRGVIFAVTAPAAEGRLVQLANGSVDDLVSRLQAGQGLAIDGADNLYFSEAAAGRVDLLVRTFKLLPLRAAIPSATQPICIDMERAPEFGEAVTLQGRSGVEIVGQPGTGSRGAVLLRGCGASSACQVTATSGRLRDVLSVRRG